MSESPYVKVRYEGNLLIRAYEKFWPVSYSPIQIELECYKENRPESMGGLGAYEHMHRAHDLLFPDLANTWFPWKEDLYRAGCAGEPFISLVGARGTAKTAGMASYSLCWLWADIGNRVVIACSTSIDAMNDRFFRYIRTYKQMAPSMPGQIVNHPKPAMYFGEGESRTSGIVAKAIKPGTAESISSEFIGIHYEGGTLLIVDEGQKLHRNATPGLQEATTNLRKKGKLQAMVAGNPQDRYNYHSYISIPVDGTFEDLDVERDQFWRTKVGGVCLRFDGHKSPALQDPLKYAFLMTREEIEDERSRLGETHPLYLTYVRGFWPQISGAQTVLNELLVRKFGVRSTHHPAAIHLVKLAGLDPAFTEGGDECILQFADLWREPDGRVVLDYGGEENTISIPIQAQSSEPEFYQICNYVKAMCAKRGVTPDCFAAETTGTGLGLGAILEKEWHGDIMQVSFSEKPTLENTGYDLNTKSKDVYDRRVTELWFQIRAYTEANKIRGMAEIAITEFCTREYEVVGGKHKIETKKSYKTRSFGDEAASGSPDRADANVVVLELAKQRFYFSIENEDFKEPGMSREEEDYRKPANLMPTMRWASPRF